ncbi:MAG: PilZ domain-containing protein [Candidatus Omnitrophica bacterium]|nr:PilZ domain-containing protein [Candidatus Omnitrophota bacterium]
MKTGNERRKYTRIDSGYLVSCEKYTIPRSAGAGSSRGKTRNLSGGGILLEVEGEYKVGDVLRLEIAIPGWEKFKAEFYKPGQAASSKPFVKRGPGGSHDIHGPCAARACAFLY